jgi:predicted AlkP superfamily phosphohydrolase/phosphomutase
MLVVLAALVGCAPASPPTRVLVVGLDGATWDVARPLLATGEMPHLAALVARGVTATPVAGEPLFAPVVWTTLFTGVPPSEHGVANWALAGAGYRRVPALWSRLDAAGRTSVLVGVPGTWKAERIRGAVVADVGMMRGYVGGAGGGTFVDAASGVLPRPYDRLVEPVRAAVLPLAVGAWSDWIAIPGGEMEAGVFRVKRVARSGPGSSYLSPIYPRDLGAYAVWPREVAAELEGVLSVPYIREGPAWSAYRGEAPAVFAEHLAQTTAIQLQAARHLLTTRSWDLFAWLDPLVDRVQHAYWREPDHARVRQAYRDADRHLGALLAEAAPAWTLVVSAHGFATTGDRGDHAPRGMLVLAGPGLEGDVGDVALVDVAPTLACLLGIARDGMRGTPLDAARKAVPSCRP